MLSITGVDATQVWCKAVQGLMANGARVPSRVADTIELSPVGLTVDNPRRRLVTAFGRPVNPAFALAEVLWILNGRNDVATLKEYNSKIGDYSDDGATFNAAYGHRIRKLRGDYLADLIATLRADQGSRQAILQIWDSTYDLPFVGADHYDVRAGEVKVDGYTEPNPNVTKDRACNIVGHAMIRNGYLNWTQFLRSNDVMWGTPNNFMQWMHVQEYVANTLGVQLGAYNHIADSFHCYDYHWDEARAVNPFNLYYLMDMGGGHDPMVVTDEALAEITEFMDAMRNSHEPSADATISMQTAGQYWYAVAGIFAAWKYYKLNRDEDALSTLLYGCVDPVLAAAQARYFWWFRWGNHTEHQQMVQDLLESSPWPQAVRTWLQAGTSHSIPATA